MPNASPPQSLDHFRDCSGGLTDGAFRERGVAREAYAPVVDVLRGCSRSELNLRQKRLDRAVNDLGLQFSEGGLTSGDVKPWRLDLFPLVLTPQAWEQISTGVVQRALAFNAYAADLYGEQKILRERVIPHALALGDPAFLRQLSGIEVNGGEYSQFGAFDLVEAGEGEWRVVEHHMGTPFGVSHVLQNRRILSQVFPELFERVDVAPVAGFSTYLLEMLRAQSQRKNPHVLLLTRGLPGQAYFEEAFIARHMGISIAQPRDLLVRESRVFLKTIRGLEPVDVIYRRVESSALDPIAMPDLPVPGVPGLINVLRKGNVAIVNAAGAGVADNRALLRYSDRIITHFLGQRPILKAVDTYNLGDLDQRNHVGEHYDDLVLKPVQDHDVIWKYCGGKRPSGSAASIERIARKHPEFFVAQSIPTPSRLPRFKDGQFDAQAVYLRVFYILGAQPIVLPGGMARQNAARHRTRRLTIATDGLKDVWVPDSLVPESAPNRLPTEPGERFSIGSRVAESLYWAGRYLERAENTARQFNTLEKLRWDQMAHSEQRTYWPLLQAVAAATGQTEVAKLKHPPRDTVQLSRSLLLDGAEGASVRACVGFARNALEPVRETISPECWEVMEEMVSFFNVEARKRITRQRLRQLSETIVTEVARFNGTAERTLTHDDTWQFYRMGIFMERAMGTVSLLRVAMPRIVQTYRAQDEENIDLTALLRLLGSLDAYRREFRSRAYIDRVAQLILLGQRNPSSVTFCLHNLDYAIGTLSTRGERDLGRALQGRLRQVIESLQAFGLARGTSSAAEWLGVGNLEAKPVRTKPKQVAEELAVLADEIKSIHGQVEDVFFNHQGVFAHDPVLFDLG